MKHRPWLWVALVGAPLWGAELPVTGVVFKTSDAFLQRLFDAAEEKAATNIVQFTAGMKAMVEGPTFPGVFLETQPMGGEMYAKRDLQIALNNQIILLMNQRADGRLPGLVRSGAVARKRGWDKPDKLPAGMVYRTDIDMCPEYRALQGNYLATSALKMYFLAARNTQYLQQLYQALEAYDAYLWRTRDSDGNGVLESWCAWDIGEDFSVRYFDAPDAWPHDYPPTGEHMPDPSDRKQLLAYWPQLSHAGLELRQDRIRVPYQSMEMMAFSFDNRRVLARISSELGNGKQEYWNGKAEEVRRRAIEYLWRPEKRAFYDRDKDNRFMDVLLINNLRAMYFSLATQAMADAFIRDHLLNPAEFWTATPLPVLAANDPLFRAHYRHAWEGPGLDRFIRPRGLTYQRAIRALENYGHYAEVVLVGEKLIANVGPTCHFARLFDPFTGEHPPAPHDDKYGPTILATLEYLSRMYGVYRDEDRLYWSGLARPGQRIEYTQRWGRTRYTLRNENGSIAGWIDGVEKFRSTSGVRVVTDLDGTVLEIIGIDWVARRVALTIAGVTRRVTVRPNQVYSKRAGKLVAVASTAFDFPFRER